MIAAVSLPLGLWWAAPSAADPRLERAQEHTEAQQERLDGILARIDALEASVSDHEAELEALRRDQDRHREQAGSARGGIARHVRSSYVHGQVDPAWGLFLGDDLRSVTARTRLLGALATREQTVLEEALAAREHAAALARRAEELLETLEQRRAELAEVKEEAGRVLAEAERAEQGVRATIAAERRQQVARAARATRAAGAAAPVNGDIACPIGQPRSFTDTYGAPRSGGRSHRGTDMLAPHGTSIHAYEAGTISRMSNNRLGGVTLYLRGASGTTYYYAHLSGYVGGLTTGQRVQAGEHIANNGSTGNAPVPHLHIEVMPGGGGNVNPYPYMRRACG